MDVFTTNLKPLVPNLVLKITALVIHDGDSQANRGQWSFIQACMQLTWLVIVMRTIAVYNLRDALQVQR